MIVERLYDQSARAIQSWPCYTCRASSIGDPCERKLVYEITNWADRKLHDVHLERIFAEGRLHEEAVLQELAKAGIRVQLQQSSFRVGMITGHVDGVLLIHEGDREIGIPLEIKSMSEQIWKSIFVQGPTAYTWDQVAHGFSTRPWLRKYHPQCQIYCQGKDAPRALLIAKNKTTGALAEIDIPRDEDVIQMLIARAERVHAHVQAGSLPDRIAYDDDLCGKCEFGHICMPDTVGIDPVALLDDEVVLELLANREAAQEAHRQFESIDQRIKAWVHARPERKLLLGDWLITKRETKRGIVVTIARTGEVVEK